MITQISNAEVASVIMQSNDDSAELIARRIDRFEQPIISDSIIWIYKDWYAKLVEQVIVLG